LPRCQFILNAPKPRAGYPIEINTLGEHLRRRRLDLDLTQRETAATLAVDVQTLRNWEAERTQPRSRYLPRIVAFLTYTPYQVPESFGQRLKMCRTMHGYTQKQLAAAAGVDPSTVRSWELDALDAAVLPSLPG
jgi:transcriptional regulator with XRE-family HTH domain